ncbi:Ribose import ATP-binding protein RbsA [compost metagenome]
MDVGATEGVHKLLMELRQSGSGVLLISEDLDELLQLSDRILVIYNGQIIGEQTFEEANREQIGMLMAGIKHEKGAAV